MTRIIDWSHEKRDKVKPDGVIRMLKVDFCLLRGSEQNRPYQRNRKSIRTNEYIE